MTASDSDIARLEARLRYVEDRLSLWDLVAKYAVYVDDRDFEKLLTLITKDGIIITDTARSEGHEQIWQYFLNRYPSYGPTFHYPHTQIVEFSDDDHAHGFVTHHAELSVGDTTLWCGYRYIDKYVRESDGWKVAERGGEFVYALPLADLPTGMSDPMRKRRMGSEAMAAELPESKESWRAWQSLIAEREKN